MTTKVQAILFICILALFVFLRLWKLDTSLHFVSDIGRDALVLQEWASSRKPPLLGPQNSAIAFNQSAWYFYLLFPLFMITHHSVFSPVFTGLIIYLASFLISWQITAKHTKLRWVLIGTMGLMAIHPEFIRQTRFIWNPSLVAPAILTASMAWLVIREGEHKWYLYGLLGLCLAASLGFSYASVPVVGAFLLNFIFKENKKAVAYFLGGLTIMFAPTIAFYARHSTLITQLFERGLSSSAQDHTLMSRVLFISRYAIADDRLIRSFALVLAILIPVILVKLLSSARSRDNETKVQLLAIIIVSIGLYLILPITFFPHYIFALATILIIGIYQLPKHIALLLTAILAILWITPSNISRYIEKAPRTVEESLACTRQICEELTKPTFVSVTSSYHPYHVGQEFRYLFTEAGCQVKAIEAEPDGAKTMLVVADGSSYQHGVSAYNELTLFGPSIETARLDCTESLSIHTLEKV